jgi:hypothetical protein
MWSIHTIIVFALSCASVLALGCDGGGEAPVFPQDYASTYQEVRDCRRSPDHDLNYIRVLASPEAVTPYQGRTLPFPVGAVVLKEEYADSTCDDLDRFTVMRKEEAGYAPDSGDWSWQRVSRDFKVETIEELRCIGCHTLCAPLDGYDFTCAVP